MAQAPDDWSAAERRLWAAFRRGELCDLRTGVADRDDPFSGSPWGGERSIRAEVIAELLLAGPAPVPGRVAALKLSGAYVTGALNLAGGALGHYVELQQCRFEKKILMSEARASTMRLVGCLIPRLEASRLATDGDLHLPRCHFPQGIRLTDAKIGTDLLLNQAVLDGDRHGRALAADGLTVHQDFEADRLTSHGEISVRSGRIGGRFSLRGAQLHATDVDRYCLNLSNISVGGTLYLTGSVDGGWTDSATVYGDGYGAPVPAGTPETPLCAHGGVRLSDGRFEAACVISNAEFHLSPLQELSLRRIQTPELRFTCRTAPTGKVSLTRARVGNLVDSPASWPQNGEVGLNGFAYDSLRPSVPFSVERRIQWLNHALADYHPEPYEQLASALLRDGRADDAREVQYAKQRRRQAGLPLPGRVWAWLQDVTVGYGYRPVRAAVWLMVAWAVGTAYFAAHPPAPLKADEVPTWSPTLYALSKVLPLIDLGQGGWNPGAAGQWVATGLVVSGWLLASTVVASASRLLRRG